MNPRPLQHRQREREAALQQTGQTASPYARPRLRRHSAPPQAKTDLSMELLLVVPGRIGRRGGPDRVSPRTLARRPAERRQEGAAPHQARGAACLASGAAADMAGPHDAVAEAAITTEACSSRALTWRRGAG